MLKCFILVYAYIICELLMIADVGIDVLNLVARYMYMYSVHMYSAIDVVY